MHETFLERSVMFGMNYAFIVLKFYVRPVGKRDVYLVVGMKYRIRISIPRKDDVCKPCL